MNSIYGRLITHAADRPIYCLNYIDLEAIQLSLIMSSGESRRFGNLSQL